MQKRRSGKAARISVAVAAVLVILLLIAGTALRMHSRNMNFAEALVSFVSDTFQP